MTQMCTIESMFGDRPGGVHPGHRRDAGRRGTSSADLVKENTVSCGRDRSGSGH